MFNLFVFLFQKNRSSSTAVATENVELREKMLECIVENSNNYEHYGTWVIATNTDVITALATLAKSRNRPSTFVVKLTSDLEQFMSEVLLHVVAKKLFLALTTKLYFLDSFWNPGLHSTRDDMRRLNNFIFEGK